MYFVSETAQVDLNVSALGGIGMQLAVVDGVVKGSWEALGGTEGVFCVGNGSG